MRSIRRVVLDTSTLVSAALRIESVPYQALVKALSTDELCASRVTLAELEKVFQRRKFDNIWIEIRVSLLSRL
jgi:predicted nucleic acid-binding protein